VIVWLLWLLARQGWGCTRVVFMCVLRIRKRTGLEQKKKRKKNEKGPTYSNPHKMPDLHRPWVFCVCACLCYRCACDSGVSMLVWVAYASRGDEQCRNVRASVCQRQGVGKADVGCTGESGVTPLQGFGWHGNGGIGVAGVALVVVIWWRVWTAVFVESLRQHGCFDFWV